MVAPPAPFAAAIGMMALVTYRWVHHIPVSMSLDFSRLIGFLIVPVLGLPAQSCHALNPTTPVEAYRHDAFDSRAGAPRDAFSMVQTADGWLWFGTPTGLYRYDGVRFQAFHPAPGERLLGRYVAGLLAHPNGELWISYLYGGMSVLHRGRLRHLPPVSGKPIGVSWNMAADGANVWVASSTGLFRYRDGSWQRFGAREGFGAHFAGAVYRDHYGRLWTSGAGHVYGFDRAANRFERLFAVAGDTVFVTSPDGRVWAADGTTVRLLPAPRTGWRSAAAPSVRQDSDQTLFDRDGNYWVGNCPSGSCVLRPAHQQGARGSFPDLSAKGSPNDGRIAKTEATVTSLLEDREGNLWIATSAGVERLRDTRLVPVVLPPASGWPSMALDTAGTVWIASTNMASNGRLWMVRQGLPIEQQTGQRSTLVVRGRNETVLVAGERWIERRQDRKVVARYPMPRNIRGMPVRNMALLLAEDRDGLWLYQGGRGLLRLRDGIWTPVPAQEGLARAIYAFVDAEGRAWFGTRDGRVIMLDGRQRFEYGAADGISLGAVTFVHAGLERIISGDNGTAIWDGQRFRPLQAEDVDLANVSGLVATGEGDRWLNTRHGLFHVKAADWQRSIRDARQPLRGMLLDELDGFPGTGHGISPVPTLLLDREGRLWVSGSDGVAVLDRKRMALNKVAPAASTLALSVDGRQYANGIPPTLAAGTRRLRFDFSAPSFTMPERVRFRYRLAGFDHGWLNAGTMRTASYTNLGPGEYRFQVQAINEDGIAGPVATTPAFRIEPTIVQSGWFAALCALASCLAIWLMYRWRLGRIERAWQLRMDERIAERERIARALHDTFLQGVQGLIFRLDAVVARLSPVSKEREQMEILLDVARKVTEDGRNQVMDLRDVETHLALDAALSAYVDDLPATRNIPVSIRHMGTPRLLAPDVRREVESIAREAIANGVRHAQASRLEVVLDWTGHELALFVIDDGVGLEPQLLAHGRPGHWGLQGMRERAARIGAVLAIRNRKQGGVEVSLRLGSGKKRGWWNKAFPPRISNQTSSFP